VLGKEHQPGTHRDSLPGSTWNSNPGINCVWCHPQRPESTVALY